MAGHGAAQCTASPSIAGDRTVAAQALPAASEPEPEQGEAIGLTALRGGPAAKVEETYERDTDDPETQDLLGLLLPGGKLPATADRFSLQYSQALLDGWVKQHSPACAAASVAGTWNALMGLGRQDPAAESQNSVRAHHPAFAAVAVPRAAC